TYRTPCAMNRSLASLTTESGFMENRHRVSSSRVPWDRPSEYQITSAPSAAAIAAPTASGRFIWPEPDRALGPGGIGGGGIGIPACTANTQAKTSTTPY